MEQVSLFNDREVYNPLASRLCPDDLDGFAGQEHLLGKGKLLCQLIEQDKIPSMIFWGPSGVGKTALAGTIAKRTNAQFVNFGVVTSGIKGIKEVMIQTKNSRRTGTKTLLFVDEIYYLNKAQQDTFLPHVEKGSIILIGATTENPFFETNSALLSRCRVFVLQALTENSLARLIETALRNPKGLGYLNVRVTDPMINMIAGFTNGDARTALNALEMAVTNGVISPDKTTVTGDVLKQCIGKKSLLYDRKGEGHYNLMSALCKFIHNSDLSAAVYWLARMLEAGEGPLCVTCRLVRLVSGGVGMTDSQAPTLAMSAYQACRSLRMPECNAHLSHTVIYLSMVPKSSSAYMAYELVRTDAQNILAESVPPTIRNTPTGFMKGLYYDDGYMYTHGTGERMARVQCLSGSLAGREYYYPTDQGAEGPVKSRLERIRKWKRGQ